jgi:hypothetical protein
MTPSAWISERRYRLLDLVRHNWGEDCALQLRYAIDEYLRAAPDLARLHVQVREMSARLYELDPPPKVDRDNGVKFTGD